MITRIHGDHEGVLFSRSSVGKSDVRRQLFLILYEAVATKIVAIFVLLAWCHRSLVVSHLVVALHTEFPFRHFLQTGPEVALRAAPGVIFEMTPERYTYAFCVLTSNFCCNLSCGKSEPCLGISLPIIADYISGLWAPSRCLRTFTSVWCGLSEISLFAWNGKGIIRRCIMRFTLGWGWHSDELEWCLYCSLSV